MHPVFTVARVPEMLGEEEDWFNELSLDLDSEDGYLSAHGIEERETLAFTPHGMENLRQVFVGERVAGRAASTKSMG